MSHYKNLLLIFLIILAVIYAVPNTFGDYPALQIKGANNEATISTALVNKINSALQKSAISYTKISIVDQNIVLCFANPDSQLQAKDLIQNLLGDDYLVTINLAPAAPQVFSYLKAFPMKLGLDLRGGVNFLLHIDLDSVIKQNLLGNLHRITQDLRAAHILYSTVSNKKLSLNLEFPDRENAQRALEFLSKHYPDFIWNQKLASHDSTQNQWLIGTLSDKILTKFNTATIEQVMSVLRNRVNELGIAEAIVQKQGQDNISIDLPGVQDIGQAKNILGKTATLEFHLVANFDANNDPNVAQFNDRLYYFHGQKIWLKNQVVLRGSSIINADFGINEEDGLPIVKIRLNGTGSSFFTKITTENIGNPMAVVYVETKSKTQMVNNQPHIVYTTNRQIISIPIIQSPLGNNFQITGIKDITEARNLALLLRSGSLPAPVSIIAERQLGPSLGQHNIHVGIISLTAATVAVAIFMIIYYGLLGLIADLALIINLIMIIALLSILGATLTFSGIAGIVLTMGMAIDANVLIFERIREELRNGSTGKASITLGYDKAFNTIFDANLTTLIVAVVLFSLGSGVVKGIAVTLTIGIITSMFTAVTITRALVNWWYAKSNFSKISIGI